MSKSPEIHDHNLTQKDLQPRKACSLTEAFSRECLKRHQAKSSQESQQNTNLFGRLSEKLKAIFTSK